MLAKSLRQRRQALGGGVHDVPGGRQRKTLDRNGADAVFFGMAVQRVARDDVQPQSAGHRLFHCLVAAQFQCFRLLRLRSRFDGLDEDWLQSQPAPLMPHGLRLDVARAIAALPPAYRVVLLLRDVDELTAPEVAAELGLSLDAVKSRLHRARAMLRQQLGDSSYWRKDAEGEA